jgi:hypothetical protein
VQTAANSSPASRDKRAPQPSDAFGEYLANFCMPILVSQNAWLCDSPWEHPGCISGSGDFTRPSAVAPWNCSVGEGSGIVRFYLALQRDHGASAISNLMPKATIFGDELSLRH